MEFKLFDRVLYPEVDNCPFVIINSRHCEYELQGDFSGGTNPDLIQRGWVRADKLQPYPEPSIEQLTAENERLREVFEEILTKYTNVAYTYDYAKTDSLKYWREKAGINLTHKEDGKDQGKN